MRFVFVGICGLGGRCRDVVGGYQCICLMGRIGFGCRQRKKINIVKLRIFYVCIFDLKIVFLYWYFFQKVIMFIMLKV